MRARETAGTGAFDPTAGTIASGDGEFDMGTSYCKVVDAEFRHRFRFIQVAAIEDDRHFELALQMGEVRALELLPLCHDHEGVRTGQRVLLRIDEMQALEWLRFIGEIERESTTAFRQRHGIVSANRRAALKQRTNQPTARRLA